MIDFVFKMPNLVEVGFGKSKETAKRIKTMGLSNILVVIAPIICESGYTNPFFEELKNNNIHYHLFDEIINEPSFKDIDDAIYRFNNLDFDAVIGIGGGSVIDVAKVLAVALGGGIQGSSKNYAGINLIEKRGIISIMIPTTSGTGAEATPNGIFIDTTEESKKGIVSDYLIPDIVILDPSLTFTLPPKITAETGIDAFTHAIECFIGNKANPFSDVFALEAIKLITQNLIKVIRRPDDKEARYQMLLASFFGGVAITNSGTGGVHALSYPLGGKFGISHGLSNAILLTEVMAFNAKAVPDRFQLVADAMGIEKGNLSQDQIVELTIQEIRKLVKDAGISAEMFSNLEPFCNELADLAITQQRLLSNNPRQLEIDDAREIYKKVFRKGDEVI